MICDMILIGILVILFIDLPYLPLRIVLMMMKMKKKDNKCFSVLQSSVRWVIVGDLNCRLVLNKVTACFL